ncbi:MAG: nucleotidyl transferase AbiEii/AbiGii toxin family protein [Candidatus Cloacimonetes bacterium]|nr:nucleotidyl transferase AbiEii/AbiGii toxin family protein [Candidatus Cloacimonadota bacterium]
MQLHENSDSFSELLQITAEDLRLPQIYIEKDYWVTKALKYLSESSYVSQVVFKGGTSLSKAYKLVERFSEDIDLAIFIENRTDSEQKSLLKNIEYTVTNGLSKVNNDPRISKGSKIRKTVYQYPHSTNGSRFGQISPDLLIEISVFTNPEPHESKRIQSLVAEFLSRNGNADLITKFNMEDFNINVLSVRRTLVEKVLSIVKDSYSENPELRLSNRIRHLYDICLILRRNEYRTFVQSDEFMKLCLTCIAEEIAGSFNRSECFDKPLVEAPLFSKFNQWLPALNRTYTTSFKELVFGDLPAMSEITETITFLRENLNRFELQSP